MPQSEPCKAPRSFQPLVLPCHTGDPHEKASPSHLQEMSCKRATPKSLVILAGAADIKQVRPGCLRHHQRHILSLLQPGSHEPVAGDTPAFTVCSAKATCQELWVQWVWAGCPWGQASTAGLQEKCPAASACLQVLSGSGHRGGISILHKRMSASPLLV